MNLRTRIAILLTATALLSSPCVSRAESFERSLDAVGAGVERFWDRFSSISCVETVEQLKLDPEKGKVLNSKRSTYDYLVLMQWIGADLAIEESRLLKNESKTKKKKRPSHRALLVTNGFAIMLAVFHPHYQSSYLFTRMPQDATDSRGLIRVDFEHVSGSRSPSALRLKDVDYPLEWKGSAWIDPESDSVVRIKAGLKAPISEIGLARLDSEVWYEPTRLGSGSEAVFLPAKAVIEAGSKRQLWRNTHLFSDYKQFSVETEIQIADPE